MHNKVNQLNTSYSCGKKKTNCMSWLSRTAERVNHWPIAFGQIHYKLP